MKYARVFGILGNLLLLLSAVFLFVDFTPLDLLPKNRNLRAAISTLEAELYLTKDVPGAKMQTAGGKEVIPKTEQAAAVISYVRDHIIGELPPLYKWDHVVGAMLAITPPTDTNLATFRSVELIILPKNEDYRTMFPPVVKFDDLKEMVDRDHRRSVQGTVGLFLMLGFFLQWLSARKRLSLKTEPSSNLDLMNQ